MADQSVAAAPAAGRASGGASAEQPQQPQQQSVFGRLSSIVLQVLLAQAVMQLVGSLTGYRSSTSPQQQPQQPLRTSSPEEAAASGSGSSLLYSVPQHHLSTKVLGSTAALFLPPSTLLLNAFPPASSYDVFVHLKFMTLPEKEDERQRSDRKEGFGILPGSSGGGSEDYTELAALYKQLFPAPPRVKEENEKKETSALGSTEEKETSSFYSKFFNKVGESLKEFSPPAATTAVHSSSSGSRSLFPFFPLWTLWPSNSSNSRIHDKPTPPDAVASVIPQHKSAVQGQGSEAGPATPSETVTFEPSADGEELLRENAFSLPNNDYASPPAFVQEAPPLEKQQQKPLDAEKKAHILYWGGPSHEVWRLLDQKYVYERWLSSKEVTFNFSFSSSFLKQLASLPPSPVSQPPQAVEDSSDDSVEAAVQEEPFILPSSSSSPDRRRTRTVLCLVTTVIPHWAYKNGRPDNFDTPPEVDEDLLVQRSSSLLQAMPLLPPREEEEHSLLLGGEKREAQTLTDKKEYPIVWHLKNRVDISLIYDTSQHSTQNFRVGPMQHVVVRPSMHVFEPILYHSDFWLLEKNYIPLNQTLSHKPLNLTISFGVGSLHGWLLQEQLSTALQQQQQLGFQSTKEAMMFKRILIETNPFMLAFSTAFILLHSVFSFFAFKNDMQFWYRNASMEGLSALSLVFNFICEIIIGLYLFDSGETSWLILFEIGLGILLSAWKVTKAVKIEVRSVFPFFRLDFTKSYTESNTKELDSLAIKWMSILLAPCVVAYAAYALIHNKYRSWFSYIISVLAGSVYTFGFVTMTPQLYINYKLKSVDHLPWRALVYRSLNTFVDDVASFLIDMPWMHRLSCFRDDIIFVCYLYQRWIYKVDKTRVGGVKASSSSPAALIEATAEEAVGAEAAGSSSSEKEEVTATAVSEKEEEELQQQLHLDEASEPRESQGSAAAAAAGVESHAFSCSHESEGLRARVQHEKQPQHKQRVVREL